MRITTSVSLLGAVALAAVAGCVHDVDQPGLAGPSTFAHSIVMVADRDTLLQNGVDFTDIRITSLSPNGTSENVQLRAQIYVDGVPNDFGTLSTKSPLTPATIRYTAPPAVPQGQAQVPTTVTIGVTLASGGDFRGESTRTIDLNLQPVGIIQPINANLRADFTFAPSAPQVGQTVSFDASISTNSGTACLTLCSYAWDFGDGAASTGLTTTHQFRTSAIFPVKLTVTDPRGATATTTKSLSIALPSPPTGSITVSPTPPVGTGTDIFFNASGVQWAGRTITSYGWNFGDGGTGSGVTTTHKYSGVGTYSVALTVTDSGGAQGQLSTTVVVNATGGALASFTAEPLVHGTPTVFNASASTPSTGASIVSYKFNYGDGTPEETTSNPVQSHTYLAAGPVTATVTTTDSSGKTSTATKALTIS